MSAGYYGARLRAQGLVPFRKYNIHTYLHRYIHTHTTYIHYIWFDLFCLLVCVRGSGGAHARARASLFKLELCAGCGVAFLARMCPYQYVRQDVLACSNGFESFLIVLESSSCYTQIHADTFLSRSEPSHFRTQMHLPETITDLLPYGMICTPSRPDHAGVEREHI